MVFGPIIHANALVLGFSDYNACVYFAERGSRGHKQLYRVYLNVVFNKNNNTIKFNRTLK